MPEPEHIHHSLVREDFVDDAKWAVDDFADGGFATLFEDGAGSYTSNDGGGTLRVVQADAGSITACFAYTAGGDGSVDVQRGAMNATLATN